MATARRRRSPTSTRDEDRASGPRPAARPAPCVCERVERHARLPRSAVPSPSWLRGNFPSGILPVRRCRASPRRAARQRPRRPPPGRLAGGPSSAQAGSPPQRPCPIVGLARAAASLRAAGTRGPAVHGRARASHASHPPLRPNGHRARTFRWPRATDERTGSAGRRFSQLSSASPLLIVIRGEARRDCKGAAGGAPCPAARCRRNEQHDAAACVQTCCTCAHERERAKHVAGSWMPGRERPRPAWMRHPSGDPGWGAAGCGEARFGEPVGEPAGGPGARGSGAEDRRSEAPPRKLSGGPRGPPARRREKELPACQDGSGPHRVRSLQAGRG